MPETSFRIALNHMVAPQLELRGFFRLARGVGVDEVEIRNDLEGRAILDGTAAAEVRRMAADEGVRILTINALQKFNLWSGQRASEAEQLIDYAAACGSEGLVLVAANDGADPDPASRVARAAESLSALGPMLAARGVTGLVECLGFASCSLRSKREAVAAVAQSGHAHMLKLVHDTFHHTLAGEPAIFAAETGLVHVSGVDDPGLSPGDMRDRHRVLVGDADRLGNISQIRALRAAGYAGPLSLEPFAPELRHLAEPARAIGQSIEFIRAKLSAAAA